MAKSSEKTPKKAALKKAVKKPRAKPVASKPTKTKNQPVKKVALTIEQIRAKNADFHITQAEKYPFKPDQHRTGANKAIPKTQEQWDKFIEVLAATANVSKAAEAANISRLACYDRKRADKEFAQLWETAFGIGYEALEEEARRRAFEGYEKPVYFRGQIIDTALEFSDHLATFLLKGRMRKVFGDKQEVTVNNGTGRPYAKYTDEEIDELIAKRLGGEE